MRNKRLDILRCVAVLLVIFCHANPPGPLALGWVGVDLFFVLSGFLISGLLFKEYLERGAINFKRFWMRRGLKIFPSFYVMLGATLLYQTIFHQLSGIGRYASEIFYMQNYGGAIWGHTWSLAVEEHFYILLPIYLLLLIRRSQGATDPFKPFLRTRHITPAIVNTRHFNQMRVFRFVQTRHITPEIANTSATRSATQNHRARVSLQV